MKLSNRTLGIIAILCSPFFFAELRITQYQVSTRSSGIYDLIYMTGWMCTVAGLLRMEATGRTRKSKIVLYLQLIFLTLANVWNIWTIIDPNNKSTLYAVLDIFWPVSNLCLLAIGIIIAVKSILKGWQRYSVLAAGLWLPLYFLIMLTLGKSQATTILGIYTTLGWGLMGYMIFTLSQPLPSLSE